MKMLMKQGGKIKVLLHSKLSGGFNLLDCVLSFCFSIVKSASIDLFIYSNRIL